MQANFERGKAASGVRSVGRFAILAGVPLIAAWALSTPDPALAACGASRPAGVHAAASGGGSVHAATSTPTTSGGGGGGGGSLGCPNGSSASALRGLPVAASGRVVERGVHSAAHTGAHMRAAVTRATNATAHLHGSRPAHHA